MKIKILDSILLDKKIKRLAWEIFENNLNEKEIIFVGIAQRGFKLAKRLKKHLDEISKIGSIVLNLKLDKDNPYNKEVILDGDIMNCADKVVILCDDVLNSGKTLMYASKHFLDIPLKSLSIVVLVNRDHNRYPIKANYVGLSLATTLQDYIKVSLNKSDQGVYLS
jgi:pyrimidine operon attenuation protein/uracil phosphoribosyltransferase